MADSETSSADPLLDEDRFDTAAVDGSEETEDEAPPLSVEDQRQAYVTGSDWTTATILDQLRRGNIDLSPRFQRREVWRPDRKSRFIESIVLNLPIPQIVLAESPGQRNKYIVLDGKQRLLTIRQFCADPSRHPEDAEYRTLELTGLSAYPELDGSTYAKLMGDPARWQDRDAFDNHTIRTVVVRNWPSEDYLFRVFLRLNSNTVPLSPQELRQALKPGAFTEFLDDRATSSLPLRRALGQAGPDFRMRDNELLLRALAFKLRSDTYAGNLKKFLDDAFDAFNAGWDDLTSSLTQATDDFEAAIDASMTIFQSRAFSRFRPGRGYDRRFNRAVFDVFAFNMADETVREAAISNRETVLAAYEALCSSDQRFIDSISTTTKSVPNTAYRFSAFAEALSTALEVTALPPAGLHIAIS